MILAPYLDLQTVLTLANGNAVFRLKNLLDYEIYVILSNRIDGFYCYEKIINDRME